MYGDRELGTGDQGPTQEVQEEKTRRTLRIREQQSSRRKRNDARAIGKQCAKTLSRMKCDSGTKDTKDTEKMYQPKGFKKYYICISFNA